MSVRVDGAEEGEELGEGEGFVGDGVIALNRGCRLRTGSRGS